MAAVHSNPGGVGMLIRPLNATDRAAIAEMLDRCGAFNWEEIRVALEVFEEGLSAKCPDAYVLFGAEVEGGLRGYVCVGHVPLTVNSWDIYWLCVHPCAQRLGLGRALLAHGEDYVRQQGGGRMVAQTSGRADYARAHEFYASLGYALVGRVPDYFSEGDDGLFFCKVLPGGAAKK